jgi:hypothetical protein
MTCRPHEMTKRKVGNKEDMEGNCMAVVYFDDLKEGSIHGPSSPAWSLALAAEPDGQALAGTPVALHLDLKSSSREAV